MTEMLLEYRIHGILYHKGIINGYEANWVHPMPALLASARDTIIHHIIRYNEETLQLQFMNNFQIFKFSIF